jgi:[protein-PII] uridylyltransferase
MSRFRADPTPPAVEAPLPSLREELLALPSELPDDALAARVRDMAGRMRRALEDRHREGSGGLALARMHARSVDEIVTALHRRAARAAGDGHSGLALFAMGGYGREEMAPHSDVDLLFLTESESGGQAAAIARTMVRLLWDSGFTLGHTVHTVEDVPRIQAADTDFKSALLESRFLCGEPDLGERVEELLEEVSRSERPQFLEAKIDDTLRRHARFGASYHLIEPNVKMSPGGLRDLHTILWMGAVLPWGRSLEEWRERKLLDRDEMDELHEAHDFLLRARNQAHFLAGKKRDLLDLALQKDVADALGYRDRGISSGVELFMKDYYARSRFVHQFAQDLFHHVAVEQILPGSGTVEDRELGAGLTIRGGRLDGELDRDRLESDPFYVFRVQQGSKIKLSRSLRRALGRALGGALEDPANLEAMRRGLFEIFVAEEYLGQIVRRIHELDLLVHLIPEFGEITSLKKYDLYHQYTADEHSLKVLENLEDFAVGRSGEPELESLFEGLADPLPLHLAGLLHDVGKGRPGDHSEVGADMARDVVGRLGGAPELADAVARLVRRHLLLSHVGQRRDVRDPDTLGRFLEDIRDEEELVLLYLLTVADMKATSPRVWNDWKATLLRGLFTRARSVLRGEPYEEIVRRGEIAEEVTEQLEGREEEAARHLELLPERYGALYAAEDVGRHLEMVRGLRGKDVVAGFAPEESWTRVEVCTRDHPARLSQICGALTVNDLDIHSAEVFTRDDGIVLDAFVVAPLTGGPQLEPRRRERIRRTLERVMAGDLDLEREVSRHARKWKRRVETAIEHPVEVRTEEDPSGRFSILDVFCRDRPGLLFEITRIFSRQRFDIHLAFVSTQANRAVDAFYVTSGREGPVEDERRLSDLREALLEGLET